ncbi:MAG: ribonuclease P protein component [bacterium]
MLQKENRLKKNRDFQGVQKNGRYYHGDFLGIKISKSNQKEVRVGIIAVNKAFNNAPERNKARRRVREILRVRVKQFKKGLDIVVILKKGINTKSFKEVAAAIDSLMEQAGVFQEFRK